ncbi:MAG TPA: tetratricopeptide repeat protein, partial [Actinomycetota bacterium]|nr:tetratricopeptide repeat protein [Actinomycetota bacterium]
TRRWLHGRIATSIERTETDPTARADALSFHFFHARMYEKCWRYSIAAGQRAEAQFANVEAVELYTRALTAARYRQRVDDDEVARTHERLGGAAALAGMYERALAALARALRMRRDDPIAVARICVDLARVSDRAGRKTAMSRWLRRGLDALEAATSDDASRVRGRLLVMYAFTSQQKGKARAAIRWCNAAIAEATRIDDKRILADAYLILDWAYVNIGRADLATSSQAALTLFEELGDLGQQAALFNNLGGLAYFRGDWTRALDLYQRAEDCFNRIGNVLEAAYGRCNIAEVLTNRGRLDEAESILNDVMRLWRSLGFGVGIGIVTKHLGRVHLRRGDLARARALFDDAAEAFARHGLEAQRCEVDAWSAETSLRAGDAAAASERVGEIRQRPATPSTIEPLLSRVEAHALHATGSFEEARSEAERGVALARRSGDPFELACSIDTLLSISATRGERPLDLIRERDELLARLNVAELPPPPLTAQAFYG